MKYAHNAATNRRVVHTVAELQMALADKARGQRIAQLRKRKRLTQQAMAERLHIAYRTYQTWEAGTMPEWPNLEKLAGELGVRPEDLIGDDHDMTPEQESQLDRIEAKLDELIVLLTNVPDVGPAEVLEAEADRLDAQRKRNDAAAKRTRKRRSGS